MEKDKFKLMKYNFKQEEKTEINCPYKKECPYSDTPFENPFIYANAFGTPKKEIYCNSNCENMQKEECLYLKSVLLNKIQEVKINLLESGL